MAKIYSRSNILSLCLDARLFSVKHPDESLFGCKIDAKSAFKKKRGFSFEKTRTLSPSFLWGISGSSVNVVLRNSKVPRITGSDSILYFVASWKGFGQTIYQASLEYIDESFSTPPRDLRFWEFFSMDFLFLRLFGMHISWKKLDLG